MTPPRAFLGFLFYMLSFPVMTGGTTIRAVSVNEMLEHAELVFDGRVSSIEVRGGQDPSSIHTCARFDVLEILNGPDVGESIELCFAGGTRGGFRHEIEGIVYPTRGERGVYFVESLTQRYVNPFYGWQQGHFRTVLSADRIAREVRVSDGRPVVNVDRTDAPSNGGLSTGVARGVQVAPRWAIEPHSMTLEGFKAKLRKILQGLR